MSDLKTGWAFVALAFLTSCAVGPSSSMVAFNNARAAEQAQADSHITPYVGNDYWITRKTRLVVCDDHELKQNCEIRWGRFHVDRFYDDYVSTVKLQVTFDGRPSGFAITSPGFMAANFLTQEPPFQPNIQPSFLDFLPKKAAAERRKLSGVLLGMSEAEVLESSWGKPEDTKLVLKGQIEKAIWYYPHGNTLYFEDGQLIKIAK